MTLSFKDIVWKRKTSDIIELLDSEDLEECLTINAGMEATVYKVISRQSGTEFALKCWNKRPPGNVEKQYLLLEKLVEVGLPVSKPYAWGLNSNHEFILLTSYDGEPLPVNHTKIGSIQTIANKLVEIHHTKPSLLKGSISKKESFKNYFFPIDEGKHTDITKLVDEILSSVQIRSADFIHGDYNLGNILFNDDQITVIDWTDAQLGDRRYDFAWASFLIKIYSGDDFHREFVQTYTDQLYINDKDIYLFEMLASLRWIWIHRVARIPMFSDTINRVRNFIEHHNELKVIDFPK